MTQPASAIEAAEGKLVASPLFSPIRIGSMEVKNRIVMPAMILNYPIENYTLSPEWCEFYARGARGGAGLIICGATYSEVTGKQDEHQLGADCDEWLPALRQIADAIHANGAKAAVQLNHAGRYSWKSVTGVHPVAPSPIYTQYTKLVPRELATTEVEQVIANFADAALRCKRAGFDAVELLGATGYLISQFLSPLTNQREDRFGGSFDRRLTFVHELVRGIKQKTGEDFPLIFRLSSTDNMPGGLDADDERHVAVKLAEWGVDMLNVTAGWHDSPVHQIGPSVPHGHFVPLAAKIKQEVNIPVSCAFRITGPELARHLIESGQLDMVTTARALLADPEWPNKAKAGRDDSIRRCVVCCHCFDMGFKRDVTECAINPELGRKPLDRTSSPRKILVVGAGASGLEAARVLKLRGHEVTVIEKSDHIGGKLDLAAAAPHKDEFLNLVRYFEFEMKHLGIPVMTNTAIEDFALDGYDAVIVATGSYPRRITIRGEENVDVFMAHDVLRKKVRPQGPVVILGAGLVGGETADMLIEDSVEVSLVDLVAKPFADMGATLKWVMTGRLRKAKVKMFMESTIVEISRGHVHIKHDTTAEVADGEVVISRDDPLTVVPAKSVIIAAGYISDDSMIDRIKRAQLPYIRTGDAIRSRNLRDAVLEGYKAATEWVDGI